MVTFANVGSVRLPSWSSSAYAFGKYGVFSACQLSIYYNSFPVIRKTIAKSRHFTYPGLHFFVCPGDTPVAITQKRCMNEKTIQCLRTRRSMYPSIFNSFPVIRTASAKIAVFPYRRPHFCFPWRRPCDYHVISCMHGKTIQCLPNPSQHVSSE